MFIQIEQTPNPLTLKFVPGQEVMQSGTVDFPTRESSSISPLAGALFAIEGITQVFFGSDFVSISKEESKDWFLLKPEVLGVLMEHFMSGQDLLSEVQEEESLPKGEVSAEDEEVVKKIKELLDTRIRPAVAMDGGDIVFTGYKQGIVYLRMQGACAGCPSATVTLKMGIENMLRHYIPEIAEVRPVN